MLCHIISINNTISSVEYSTLNKIQYSEEKSVYEIKIQRLSERNSNNKKKLF
jgi:hypothetical protein